MANYFVLFSSLVQMNVHILFCPVCILLPLAYKQQIQHFYSLLFSLQQIGVWEWLHFSKELICKNKSAGKKTKHSRDNDFFLNFSVRAAWVCGSNYTHELSEPHVECLEGQGEERLIEGTHGTEASHKTGRYPCLSSVCKCGGPEWQSRAQLAIKLARHVTNNKDFICMLVTSRSTRDMFAAEKGQ